MYVASAPRNPALGSDARCVIPVGATYTPSKRMCTSLCVMYSPSLNATSARVHCTVLRLFHRETSWITTTPPPPSSSSSSSSSSPFPARRFPPPPSRAFARRIPGRPPVVPFALPSAPSFFIKRHVPLNVPVISFG